MENTTTRLPVNISKLPDWEISWENSTPQGSRKDLTEEDILANEDDGQIMYEHVLNLMFAYLLLVNLLIYLNYKCLSIQILTSE